MIKAVLIDDESHCLGTLEIMLKEYCATVQIVNKCRSAADGFEAIEKNKPDLVFLDIEMPGKNGFEMLEQFNAVPFAIIFTTSYDQYAIKAIRFSALDYLLKPINPDELVRAVKRVEEQKQLPGTDQFNLLLNLLQNKEPRYNKIAVPTAEGFELIPADQVTRCEAEDNYTHLFLKNKNKITACRSLKEMETQLHDFTFFVRVHNSHLVNLNEVNRYVRGEGGYLVMSDGSTVNVSRSRKDALLKYF